MSIRELCMMFTASLMLVACGDRSEQTAADNEQVQNRGAGKDNWWDALPRPEWANYIKIEQSENWFEVYLVDDDIYAIYEPGQFEEVISFLIIGEDFALMFDTGLGIGNIRRVVDQLTEKKIVVLNSHTHYDHIGGNHLFETIYGLDTDYTRQRAMGSSPDAVAGFLREGWVWKPFPQGFSAADYQSHAFTIDKIVAEGDAIDVGGRVLEILHTPGHAPDSICLLDRENRILFTGDSFYLAPLYTHIPGGNFDEYAVTATRLAGLAGDIDRAFTSHNVPVVDSSYMTALGQAFADIKSGKASDFTLSDGLREYEFDGFSVIVKDPL
ncbi:MAG: MBL fold metallo-hydrolase [Woeseiaceae bacterium]|nr:MBL fold metallo-hydrolase [Woeseiaceae bacterium]